MPMPELQHTVPQPTLVAPPSPIEIDGLEGPATDGAADVTQQTAHEPAFSAAAGVRAASGSFSDLTFDSLPTDVAEKIFAHLSPADLKYARLASRWEFSAFCNHS